jgi:hypothetical protein
MRCGAGVKLAFYLRICVTARHSRSTVEQREVLLDQAARAMPAAVDIVKLYERVAKKVDEAGATASDELITEYYYSSDSTCT